METELFGIFGSRDSFERQADRRTFERVVEGESVTVGLRDDALGQPGRSSVCTDESGVAVVWGEAFPPDGYAGSAAAWLLDAASQRRADAFASLNGSYLAVVEVDGEPFVASDPIRSWECFTTETDHGLVFGSDAASVARCIPNPHIDPQGFAEFLYLGGALNDHTPLSELDRLPLDHARTPEGTNPLGRYRHDAGADSGYASTNADPAGDLITDGSTELATSGATNLSTAGVTESATDPASDPAGELARRLERAIDRRSMASGTRGVLLSAGLDSRLLLALRDDVDTAYTIGPEGSDEVAVATQLAHRYGADHVHLPVDDRYLDRDATAIGATNGVKESLHVHHAGYTDAIDADAVCHGLLFDTLLRGYFLPWDTYDVLGLTVPRGRLDPDPDPVAHLTGVMGYLPETAELIHRTPGLDATTPDEFLEDAIGAAYADCVAASVDEYAAFDRFGVQNVLSTPFRTHLADQFTESLVVADTDLVDWHLQTPPAERTDSTFREAIRRIDVDLLDPSPPDRPHDSFLANQIEKRARRSIPGLEPFDAPWPDRRTSYAANDLDAHILPDRPDLHDYPPRFKLRIRDLRHWFCSATGDAVDIDAHLPTPS